MFVPIFKLLGPEKYLTKKKFKHTQGKRKNYIPLIYFVYQGYKDMKVPTGKNWTFLSLNFTMIFRVILIGVNFSLFDEISFKQTE